MIITIYLKRGNPIRPIWSIIGGMNKLKVMLVEDEALVLEGYKKLFDNEFEYAQKALRMQAADYMLKPVKFDELAGVVDRIRRELLKRRSAGLRREEGADGKRIYRIISYLHEHITTVLEIANDMARGYREITYPRLKPVIADQLKAVAIGESTPQAAAQIMEDVSRAERR
jgi:YesN/AraC family two-component response regulator